MHDYLRRLFTRLNVYDNFLKIPNSPNEYLIMHIIIIKKHFKATKILSSARIWKLKKKASDKHKNEQWCLTNKTFWNFSMNGVIHNILYAFNTVTFSFRTFGDWIINTVTVNIDLLYFKTGIPAHIILSSKGNIGSNYSFRVLRLKDINTDLNVIQSC